MNADLSKKTTAIVFGNEVVIPKYIAGIAGGRTLDLTGFTESIQSGHVIIKLSNGNYAPMPVSGSGYGELPASATYVGVLYGAVSLANPSASIMTNGQVNIKAVPYDMTAILSAFKASCPFIQFVEDEDSNATN